MLIGTRYVDRLAPEIAKQTAKDLMEVFKGQAKSINIEYRQNDYILDAVPIPSHDGKINHILVIERNVTKRKKEQDQVQRALEHERELNILKSRFVSTASHEFRTPLSTILSSASLLSRYQSKQDQLKREKHIERIKKSVQNLTGILNDFLSLDKLETGVVQSQPETFDLTACIQEICDQLAPTLKKHQHIRYRHQGRAEVFIDKRILTNVLLNLLSNASKYSGEGKAIDLTTRLMDGNLAITVKDQGIGISKEDQKHLFKRFFRSSNAINIAGTGLGLNIVKKYVELLDGEIEFYSELGMGSTFIVKLTQPLRS
jgi:signal transduction histidine kinase